MKQKIAHYIQLRLQLADGVTMDKNTMAARAKLIKDWLVSTRDVGPDFEVEPNQLEEHFIEYLRFAEYLMVNVLMEK